MSSNHAQSIRMMILHRHSMCDVFSQKQFMKKLGRFENVGGISIEIKINKKVKIVSALARGFVLKCF